MLDPAAPLIPTFHHRLLLLKKHSHPPSPLPPSLPHSLTLALFPPPAPTPLCFCPACLLQRYCRGLLPLQQQQLCRFQSDSVISPAAKPNEQDRSKNLDSLADFSEQQKLKMLLFVKFQFRYMLILQYSRLVSILKSTF